MRVLQAPANMAGQATTISKYLRELGIKSDVLVYNRHPFGYEHDISLDLDEHKYTIIKLLLLTSNFIKCFKNYDVFHFHFGRSLLPRRADLPILKLFGKKVIMHYWGSEIRQRDISSNYIYQNIEGVESIYSTERDKDIRRKIKFIRRYTNITIVGDYSLKPYLKPYFPEGIDIKVVKQAIDLVECSYVGANKRGDRVKIVHAPSNRQVKGTRYVIGAIERLKEEGCDVDFVLLEKMSNREVRKHCQDADIIVDQLLIESYGIFAIECMALGKPVLCRIDEHFVKFYPGLPIVNTDPDNIYQNLKMLIEDPELRAKLGLQGRSFVEAVHDARKIAHQLAEIYEKL